MLENFCPLSPFIRWLHQSSFPFPPSSGGHKARGRWFHFAIKSTLPKRAINISLASFSDRGGRASERASNDVGYHQMHVVVDRTGQSAAPRKGNLTSAYSRELGKFLSFEMQISIPILAFQMTNLATCPDCRMHEELGNCDWV